jgi:exopolysaccharide biosynthesis polyprenyl glycosylphosphotransferase
MMSAAWFTRLLTLERKRSERSRKPFVLLLLNVEALAEGNGGHTRLVHQVFSAVGSIARETDTTGWYREGSIIGVIFTELGDHNAIGVAVDALLSKVTSTLHRSLGLEPSRKVRVSHYIFPDDWTQGEPHGRRASPLYSDLEERKSSWRKSWGKRMMDVVGSSLALILLLPLLGIIALVIKLTSRGPVLFRQERVGRLGERFTFLKFRSMYVSNDHEIHKHYVKRLIAGQINTEQGGVFKIKDDPRITRVGQFLRKTSLDELPQFWNVLLGQMSLVGPRPPLPYEVDAYDIWHRRRLLEAKPGITGLWQVYGRSRICFDDMVRLDLRYAQSCSLWLDLKILLQTPRAVLAGEGAY